MNIDQKLSNILEVLVNSSTSLTYFYNDLDGKASTSHNHDTSYSKKIDYTCATIYYNKFPLALSQNYFYKYWFNGTTLGSSISYTTNITTEIYGSDPDLTIQPLTLSGSSGGWQEIYAHEYRQYGSNKIIPVIKINPGLYLFEVNLKTATASTFDRCTDLALIYYTPTSATSATFDPNNSSTNVYKDFMWRMQANYDSGYMSGMIKNTTQKYVYLAGRGEGGTWPVGSGSQASSFAVAYAELSIWKISNL